MSNRRRILKVKHKFQDRLILEVVLVTFILINILVTASFIALESIPDIYTLKYTLAFSLAAGEIGGLAVIYHFSLRSSHKIAGPVFIIERRLTELGNGDLTVSLRLRKNDHFQETSDVLNNCAASLRSKMEGIKATVAELENSGNLDGPSKALVQKLASQVNAFKTSRTADVAETPKREEETETA